jgi:transposase
MTTKILALVDGLGNLVEFRLMPGQYHDLTEVKPLMENMDFDALLADKAFDADWLLKELEPRCITSNYWEINSVLGIFSVK